VNLSLYKMRRFARAKDSAVARQCLMVIDLCGRITKIGFLFWCWKECESIAGRAKAQIERQFELHRVLVSRSGGETVPPERGAT
jgi:hypothetical protein